MKIFFPLTFFSIAIINLSLSNEIFDNKNVSENLRNYELKSPKPIKIQSELPDDFPEITVGTLQNPMEGYIYMECFQVSNTEPNYIMILDEKGEVVWYDKPANQGVDFKMQANGQFSYATRVKVGDKYKAGPLDVQNIYVQHNILDSDLNLIDSIQMQNEYLADMHDFRILPNGNILLIGYEHVPIDMSLLIPTGNPNAIVVGTVIQELNKDKECVFQWRSLDYIPVLSTKDDPRKAIFEHVHGNSLHLDSDGNLITSFPTTFEIVKIDMTSGDMIWRMGGDKNEFEFIGENEVDKPYYFRMQHDAKILPNGNLLFYDNGVQKKSGWSSRAVEYDLDQVNKTAELVWEYKHTPPVSAYAMGSAQRLPNGNTLIDWGLMFMGHKVAMTEVNENNETEFELNMPGMTFSYRAQKISQPVCEPVANVDKYEILKGNTYTFNDEVSQTGVEIEFKELDAFMYNMMNVKKYECSAINPEFESEAPVILPGRYIFEPQLIYSHTSEVRFDLNSIPQHINSDDIRVFQRTSPDSGIFNELFTEFDSQENQIKAITSEFGEFIIGFYRNPSSINPPKLMYPANNKSFTNDDTVRFVWSSTGRYDNFEIQISNDETFNNSIVLDSNNIKTPILNLSGFDSDSKYYWRTRTLYNDRTSDWSLVRNFNFTNEFLEIVYPKGPNKFPKDSTLIIRWNTNMTDSVSIKLYHKGQFVQTISESFKSVSGAFAWRIDPDLDDDTLYSVIVTNLNNPEIQSESDKFGIGTLTSVNQELEYQNNFADFEVFPNPAADIIKLSLTLNQNEFVKLEIYDVSGNLIKTVLNTRLDEGKFTIPLNVKGLEQGIYYCVLKTDSNSKVEKIIIMR